MSPGPTVPPLALLRRPRVLVAVASRHGATREIAAAVSRRLLDPAGGAGAWVTLRAVQQRPDPTDFDAVVLGSAVYDECWLPEAADYALRWTGELRRRPTWLFSSGIDGASGPRCGVVREGERIAADLGAAHAYFRGRLERRLLPRAEEPVRPCGPLADGDHRDWAAVRAWADRIATRLATLDQPVGVG